MARHKGQQILQIEWLLQPGRLRAFQEATALFAGNITRAKYNATNQGRTYLRQMAIEIQA